MSTHPDRSVSSVDSVALTLGHIWTEVKEHWTLLVAVFAALVPLLGYSAEQLYLTAFGINYSDFASNTDLAQSALEAFGLLCTLLILYVALVVLLVLPLQAVLRAWVWIATCLLLSCHLARVICIRIATAIKAVEQKKELKPWERVRRACQDFVSQMRVTPESAKSDLEKSRRRVAQTRRRLHYRMKLAAECYVRYSSTLVAALAGVSVFLILFTRYVEPRYESWWKQEVVVVAPQSPPRPDSSGKGESTAPPGILAEFTSRAKQAAIASWSSMVEGSVRMSRALGLVPTRLPVTLVLDPDASQDLQEFGELTYISRTSGFLFFCSEHPADQPNDAGNSAPDKVSVAAGRVPAVAVTEPVSPGASRAQSELVPCRAGDGTARAGGLPIVIDASQVRAISAAAPRVGAGQPPRGNSPSGPFDDGEMGDGAQKQGPITGFSGRVTVDLGPETLAALGRLGRSGNQPTAQSIPLTVELGPHSLELLERETKPAVGSLDARTFVDIGFDLCKARYPWTLDRAARRRSRDDCYRKLYDFAVLDQSRPGDVGIEAGSGTP